MKIFLVGYMGCGKSTLGPLLAERLELPFFDLDVEIERISGKSILSIFEAPSGENEFRQLEHRVLKDLIASPTGFVMACGGGTPCFFDGMSLMNSTGVTIYLQANDNVLLERLHAKRRTRPLLKEAKDNEIQNLIRDTLNKREPCYRMAQITIDASPPVWILLEHVINELNKTSH